MARGLATRLHAYQHLRRYRVVPERDISDQDEIGLPRAREKGSRLRSIAGNTMHEARRKAAEQHQLAAHAHRTAAEHNEKGDYRAAIWHSDARWSTRSKLTNWQRKPTRSPGR
jgi:hypothetical protein